MAYSGRYAAPKKKSSGSRKKLLILLVVLVVLLAGVLAAGILYINGMLGLIRRPDETGETLSQGVLDSLIGNLETDENEPSDPTFATTAEPEKIGNTQKIVNILLIGQDARAGEEAKLSDSMILCTVNKETKTLTMTSIMRDTYVKMADYAGHTCGKNRINVTYALGYSWKGEQGSFDMLDLTIENNFGVHVDYNVEVGFEAFAKVIEEVGGVAVELDTDEAAYLTAEPDATRSFQAGSYTLNGTEALSYSRMRHANAADSDFNRTARQRKVITAIIDKCRSMSLTELNNMIKVILPEVLTDMSNGDITSLAMEILPMLGDLKLENNQLPAEGTYSGQVIDIAGVASAVLVPDVAKNRELLMAIAEADQLGN